MTYTKGSYISVKQCFRIEIRNNEDFNEKYTRMKAIADYKEYQEEDGDVYMEGAK